MEILLILIFVILFAYELIEKIATSKKEKKKSENEYEKAPTKPICTMEPLILDDIPNENNNTH